MVLPNDPIGNKTIEGSRPPTGEQYLGRSGELSVVTSLTPPADSYFAQIQCELKAVRYKVTGQNPTSVEGQLLQPGETYFFNGDLSKLKFIEVEASAWLNIAYFE